MIEKLIEGLIVSVVGISITFLVMSVLIAVIHLVRYCLNFIDTLKNVEPKESLKQNNTESQSTVLNENDPEIIAAITAAVSCMLSKEKAAANEEPRAGFIIRSVRKRV